MSKLAGKVAVVTGASKGIGAAIAKGLAGAGAQVVVNYASSKAGADAVVEAIGNAGGQAVAVHGDVANPNDVKGLVDAAVKEFGRLDIVVNNSGIWDIVPIENVTEEQFRHSFDVNVLGPLVMIREALQHIAEGGSIINISSNATTLHPPGSAVYTATKSALEGMAGVLAKELGPRKIRINTILPGMVDTEGNRSKGFVGSPIEDFAVSQTPLGRIGRIGQPQDIADVAVFLASDDARWLTGERLLASGGLR
jgi:3-oxoacyl-[acyl-carrier protein] reductase